jgi:hypothetical protein
LRLSAVPHIEQERYRPIFLRQEIRLAFHALPFGGGIGAALICLGQMFPVLVMFGHSQL